MGVGAAAPGEQAAEQGKGQLNLLQGWKPALLEALSTDITEVRYANGGKKAYLMALIDIGSDRVPGWAVGPRPNREPALTCWERARTQLVAVGWGGEQGV